MKTTATLTTIAALAVAGAAAACECSTKPTKLTATTAPNAQTLRVGHEGDHGKVEKKKGESMTFKVVVDGDKTRYWVNGKEVDAAGFEKAKKKAGATVTASPSKLRSAIGLASDPAAPRAPKVAVAAPSKPRLGVVLESVSEELADKLDVDSDEVILIQRVIDGTPAAKAGLRSYDVLVEFDGHDELNVDKLRKLIAKQTPGDEVEVIVLRDGDEEEFEVVFGEIAGQYAVVPDAPDAPARLRYFGGKLDDNQQAQVEKAMKLAEQYSQRAQEQANRWTHKIEAQAKELEGMGERLALRFDVEAREDFEEAMAELHEALAEHNIDFDFNFEFDENDFPRIKFLEHDEHRNRVAVLERRLMEQAERQARQNERRHLQEERVQRQREREIKQHMERAQERLHHAEARRHHSEEAAERHIESLEARIDELEAMVEKLMEKLEKSQRPRGVRN